MSSRLAHLTKELNASRKEAEDWIEDAIERPGRVRKYLGIPEGKDIPMAKIDSAIKKLKEKGGDKSLLKALQMAKTLKRTKKKAAEGMTAEDFAKKVEAGLPSGVKKWTKARAMKSVGSMVVQVDFSYTDSSSGTDQLNAPNVRIFVTGWGKDGSADKLEAEALRKNKVPKMRKKTGAPDKVMTHIVNYFKKNEKEMTEGEPYKKAASSKQSRVSSLTAELRALLN